MEILAPAGNKEQVEAAINAGCDAVYGGLTKWNARRRATNFSVHEYNETIEYCHSKNVNFYLTINILLRNAEINDVIDLLRSNQIKTPDAVIVCDIGLVIALRKYCPQIPIHLSTQFGVCSVDDVLFAEQLGVTRVILSRELNLTEIENICINSSIEVEVFSYGSQCVAFSGQCLLGGLIHGTSGNRGRCISTCRDIYSFESGSGYYLFPQDLNASDLKRNLKNIGVHSLKIEGRMRKPEEISKIIHDLKANDNSNSSSTYNGFLNNHNPVEEMFNSVHPRVKPLSVRVNELSENDWIIKNNKLSKAKFQNGQKYADYVKTIFNNDYVSDKVNISIKLLFSGEFLSGLEFSDSTGEWDTVLFNETAFEEIRVVDIYKIAKDRLAANILELTSDKPSECLIKYNYSELLMAIAKINSLEDKEINCVREKLDINKSEVLLVRSWERAANLAKEYFNKTIIYDIEGIDELICLLSLPSVYDNIIYRLPHVDFSNSTESLLERLVNQRIIVSKLSQLCIIKHRAFSYKELIADYSLNVWNDYGTNFLLENNITGMIIHPELSLEYGIQLAKKSGIKAYAIGTGFITAGYSRGCFGLTECCSCDKEKTNGGFFLKSEQKGYSFFIKCIKSIIHFI